MSSLALKKNKPAGKMATEPEHDLYSCVSCAPPSGEHMLDHILHGNIAHFTNGISPISLLLAEFDWWAHMLFSPSKQLMLQQHFMQKTVEFGHYAFRAMFGKKMQEIITPSSTDRRFKSDGWQNFPFNIYHQGFLLLDNWWREATHGVRGVSRHHEDVVSFIARQGLDLLSPSNFPVCNPDILKTTREQNGRNFITGFLNWLEDTGRILTDQPLAGTELYKPGETVALTEGKVVFRNHLIELIQYAPSTTTVCEDPVLIVPAWIMKYYILDLQPHNSLVKYLVDKGHTVFMISWRNPDTSDRDLGLNDYLEKGLGEAMKAVQSITGPKLHGAGYCLGGTLLAIMAAKCARDGDGCLQTVTFFAAQTDFEEPGEIDLFVDESQIAYLEDIMWNQGYLDKFQMAGAFQMLRPNDLIWSRLVNDYMQGNRPAMSDLMAWNADATRMPYRMHSEYLRRLFMHNDLAEGRYSVNGKSVALQDVTIPVFAVGTVRDHVAPWKSVYKIHLLISSDVTFVLTSGGHNAGIVSEPGHPGRNYHISTTAATDGYMPPEVWQQNAESRDGSWWQAWEQWLTGHSQTGKEPPAMGNGKDYIPIADAPGKYIFMR